MRVGNKSPGYLWGLRKESADRFVGPIEGERKAAGLDGGAPKPRPKGRVALEKVGRWVWSHPLVRPFRGVRVARAPRATPTPIYTA